LQHDITILEQKIAKLGRGPALLRPFHREVEKDKNPHVT
jgi:hypothetical protein